MLLKSAEKLAEGVQKKLHTLFLCKKAMKLVQKNLQPTN